MTQDAYSARITLDGSQVEAEFLKLAQASGRWNQVMAAAVTSGLKPLAANMDIAAQKLNLGRVRLAGVSVAVGQLTDKTAASLKPQQRLRYEASKLFDQYKKLSDSAVKPTSASLLKLAAAFDAAQQPKGLPKGLFTAAAQQLRQMEALPGAARTSLRELLATERQSAQERVAARRALHDQLFRTDSAQSRLRVDLQRKEANEERRIWHENDSWRRSTNREDAGLGSAFALAAKRRDAARERMLGSASGLENRLVGSPQATTLSPLVAQARELASNVEAARWQFDEMRKRIIEGGRSLTYNNNQSRVAAAAAREQARQQREAARSAVLLARSAEKVKTNEEAAVRAAERKAVADANKLEAARKLEHAMSSQAQHNTKTEKSLLRVSSAAQGVMLGQSLLQRQVIGVGFSLIFARWAILKYMAAAAALTIVIGGAAGLTRAFIGLASAAEKSYIELEKSGQKLANFFQSADVAAKIKKQAAEMSRAYNIPRENAEKLLATLESIGLNQDVYRMADVNAAAAGVGSEGDFAQRLKDITKADASSRGEMTRQLAKDYEIPIKKYMTSLEIANAVNKRFANSAEQNGKTTSAAINQMTQSWLDFKIMVGAVVNNFLLPLFGPIMGFLNGINAGFAAALQTGKDTGTLDKNTQAFAQTMRKLIPFMTQFGYILGTVIYKVIIRTAQIIKVLADTLIRLWNKMKPVVDFMRTFIKIAKEFLDKMLAWMLRNKDIITTLGVLAFLLFGLPRLFTLVVDAITSLIGGLVSLGKAILGLPKATVDFLVKGFKEAKEAVENLLRQLGLLKDKSVKVSTDTGGIDLDKIRNYNDQLAKIPETIHTKVTQDLPTGTVAPGLPPTDGKAEKSWNLFGVKISMSFLKGMAGSLATGLGVAIGGALLGISVGTLLIAAGVVAAVIALALIVAFPRESGQIAGAIAGMLVNALALVPGLIVWGLIAAVSVVIGLMAAQFSLGLSVMIGVFRIPFDTLVNMVRNVASDVKDIGSSLFSGDWLGALQASGDLLKHIFLTPWEDMGIGIKNFGIDLKTNIIPKFFDDTWFAISGPTGIGKLIENIKEPVKHWAEEFGRGFGEGWEEHVNPSLMGFFSKAWNGINDGFGTGDNYGLVNAMRVGFRNLALIGDNIGDPFRRFKHFLSSVGDAITRFIDWLRDNAHNLNPANWIGGAISRIGVPSFGDYAMGGVVPGARGTKQLVMAEAGEVFLGAPAVAASSGRLGGLGGGGTTNIYVSVADSVITNDASITDLTDQIAGKLVQRLGVARNLTFHRI